MKKILFALALSASLSGVAMAQAEVSPEMVKQALSSGNYAQAEQELDQVIAKHPDSAKAHYVLAQVLAKEGNLQGARQQLNQASQIDPAIHFTDPARYNHFRAELNQAMGELGGQRSNSSGYVQPVAVGAHESHGGHGFGLIIGLLIVLALIALIWRAMNRARQVRPNMPPPGFNNNGYGNNNYGYGQPPQQPPYPPQGGGARSVMGQVASTAAGVAGGMLAADAIEGMLHHGGEANAATPPAFGGNGANDAPLQDIGNSSIDMGNDDAGWGGGGSFDDDDNSW